MTYDSLCQIRNGRMWYPFCWCPTILFPQKELWLLVYHMLIVNRSRNRHRNMWVVWCVSSWWPLFPSRSSVLIYIYMPSDDNSFISGCLRLLALVSNNTLILYIWCSTIPHLLGCFFPCTFFYAVGQRGPPCNPPPPPPPHPYKIMFLSEPSECPQ